MEEGQKSKREKSRESDDEFQSTKKTKKSSLEKSIDDLTAKYKKKTKFLVSPNPVSKEEKEEFYVGLHPSKTFFMSLEDQPLKPIFEEELEQILGEDYEKYAMTIIGNIDKSATGVYFFYQYLQKDLKILNFQTSINNFPMNIILDYVHYFYLRLGDTTQYFNDNQTKLRLLLNLIWIESADSQDLDEYAVEIKNPKKQTDDTLSLILVENGVLTNKDDGKEVDENVLSRYKNFDVLIDEKDNYDTSRFPTQPELLPFHFLSFKSMYTKFFNLANFILTCVNNFIKETEYILYKPNELKLPFEFKYHLEENLKEYDQDVQNLVDQKEIGRYYVVPLSLPQHHNLLIFDHQFKTIERFEPHGSIAKTLFKKILQSKENYSLFVQDGFSDILQDLKKENYNYAIFFQDPRFLALLIYVQEKYKNNKPIQSSINSLFMDIELSRLKNFLPPEYQNYTLLYPSDYEIEIGPQSYYDNRLENEFPIGMCVTFCYIYLALRTNVNIQSKQDFEQLQLQINDKYYEFLLDWYKNNINQQVVVEETEKKTFVSQAIVEFIMTVNNIYLKEFLEEINSVFNLNLKGIGGRHINL
jgi:hypothetical protein